MTQEEFERLQLATNKGVVNDLKYLLAEIQRLDKNQKIITQSLIDLAEAVKIMAQNHSVLRSSTDEEATLPH